MNKLKWFAGIGSREIPHDISVRMYNACTQLYEKGYGVRSGGAEGSDTVCEIAYNDFKDPLGYKQIFVVNSLYSGNYLYIRSYPNGGVRLISHGKIGLNQYSLEKIDRLRNFAKIYHPAWHRLSKYAQDLHTRNSCQIMGEDLDDPVDFVLCYTKDGKATGGTGQAIRIAEAHNIPVYNLYYDNIEKFILFLD